MPNLWLNLIWKVWREHQWKLVAITTIMLGLLVLTKPDNIRAWPEMCGPLLWFASAGCAVFVALGAAARENSQATRSYIESQPLAMWKLGLAKLLVGAVVVILPGLIAIGLLALFENYGHLIWPELEQGFAGLGGKEFAGFGLYSFLVAMTTGVALSFFLWTAALGANASNEVRAAGFGLGGIIAWFGLLIAAAYAANNLGLVHYKAFQSLGFGVMAVGPLGFFAAQELGGKVLVVSCLSHLLIASLYVYRFSRPAAHRAESSPSKVVETAPRRAYLSAPMRSPARALAWKGARECLPIVSVGLAGAIGAALVTMVVGYWVSRGSGDMNGPPLQVLGYIIGIYLAWFGGIVAVIIGIGAVLGDLSPKLNAFWRSRPIRPSLTFWMQVLASAAVLMLVFGAPVELAIGWAGELDDVEEFPHIFAACLLCAYSLAVCLTTLLRHAIYAAILSFGGVLFAIAAVSEPKWNLLPWANLILLAIALVAMLIAWVCYRNDWSLQA